MLTLSYPQWLLLIPALILATWVWRRLRLWRPLRAIGLLSLVIYLTEPKIDRSSKGMDLWLLVDQSASTAGLSNEALPEWKRLLNEARQGPDDRLRIVHYAGEAIEAQAGDGTQIRNRSLSQAALAIQYAIARSPENRPSRILLMSDGYNTEPLEEAANQLGRSGTPLDYRLLGGSRSDDARIVDLSTPTQATTGEPYLLRIELEGPVDAAFPIKVLRNGTAIHEGTATLKDGKQTLEFTDRISQAGAYEYQAIISPKNDPIEGNNQRQHWIEITGGPRVLLVSSYPDDPLAKSLADNPNLSYEVDLVTSPASLSAASLTGVKTVILNDVAAFDLPLEFSEALPFFVERQGGGLIMAGGRRSFGSGGYFESALDPLLPISMELKDDLMKLKVALAVVLDRSGSMGAGVAGGQTKMSLANAGTARAIQLLGFRDEISVIPVDDMAHIVIPLEQIQTQDRKDKFIQQAVSIQAGGGGIYVYNGLDAAWKELRNSKAGTRHVILFSDAADTEQPDDYKNLLAKMVRGGATVTVIGLGTDKDPDADLLKDIAKLGKGRIIFTTDAASLPQLFAQETTSIARSAFLTDPTKTLATGEWDEIAPNASLTWPAQMDAYNLSYLRPEASASLLSKDEFTAPLVAHVRRGLGRVGAISFPLAGEGSESARAWSEYGNFCQSLVNWAVGDRLPAGIGLAHQLRGTRLDLDLLYTEEHEAKMAASPPKIFILSSEPDSKARALTWSRISPGHYRTSLDLVPGLVYRGALEVFGEAISFGPLSAGSETEWALDRTRIEDLRAASRRTGGRELLDLSEAWLRPPFESIRNLSSSLILLALLCLLADALITRTGWTLPKWNRLRPQPAKQASSKIKRSAVAQPSATTPEPSTPKPEIEQPPAEPKVNIDQQKRSNRFKQAKRK